MANTREGYHNVTAYLIVEEADELIEFVKQVFEATELSRSDSSGDFLAEVRLGDTLLMIGSPWMKARMPAALYVYVKDVDATYQRAIRAGATSIEEPADRNYGDRRGTVADRFGNMWVIATYKGNPS